MNSRILFFCATISLFFFIIRSASAASELILQGDSAKTSDKIHVSISDLEDVIEYELAGEETISGINVYPHIRKKTFMLSFSQYVLKENALLTLSPENGDAIFSRVLHPGEKLKPTRIGNLNEGIYLIEVKTSDTTFWKKIRIVK